MRSGPGDVGGLAGHIIWEAPPKYPHYLDRMVGSLTHRGRGATVATPFPGVNLARIGPGSPVVPGHQALVLDGAIYNKRELASDLDLAPDVDDGVLAAALFQAFGLAGLARLNADLSFALWDDRQKELRLFRDRFGVRPLYYTRIKGGCLFASEIKAFFVHPEFEARPDEAMLFDYLATHYRYIHRDPGRTFLADVHQVPPAHLVSLKPDETRIEPYWRLELDPQAAELPFSEAADRLLWLMKDSVRRRVAGGEKMGFSVSSGMDSSSVCALAAAVLEDRVDVYSVGYDEGEYDETAGLAPVAQRCGRRWRHLTLSSPPWLELVDRLVRIHDGPLCTVTWLSHFHLARAAAEDGREVVFSGLGGDEVLAGEYEHFLYFFADLKAQGLFERLDREVEAWIRLHDHPVFRKNRAVVQDAFKRLVDLKQPGRTFVDRNRYSAYLSFFNPDFVQTHNLLPQPDCPFPSYLANRCYQDLVYETTPPSLTADEKNSSHFGINTCFPFLDHRVVTFCFSLPGWLKYDRGVTKAVMRRAMKGILPEANRKNTVKTGFNAPLNQWLLGAGKPGLLDLIHSPSFKQRGYWKTDAAVELLAGHEQGRANHMMILWQMINAELWLRTLEES